MPKQQISICNEDLTTSIFYITRPATKSMCGLNRQHNNVVNQVVNAIREVRGWRRLTVKRVPLCRCTGQRDRSSPSYTKFIKQTNS